MFDWTTISLSLSFIAFCLTQLQYGTADNSNRNILCVTSKSFDNGNLVYAVCNRTKLSVTQCTIVQKHFSKNAKTRSCAVTLNATDDQSILPVSIEVSTLGKDKAVLFYEDLHKDFSATMTIGTLDLDTCKLTEVKLPDDNGDILVDLRLLEKLVTYDDDSFDILFKDSERYRDKYGNLTINGDGTTKSKAVSKFNSQMQYHQIATIDNRSPAKGYAYFREQDNETVFGIMKPDGSEKLLANYTEIALVQSTVAINDNLLSACGAVDDESDLSCSQYDEDGNVKFTANVANKSMIVKAIRNLSGGGILVVLTKSKWGDTQTGWNNEGEYRIIKIAADGKIMGFASIKEFNKISTLDPTEIYVNEDSEYCVAKITRHLDYFEGKPTDYEIPRHCVKENELTV